MSQVKANDTVQVHYTGKLSDGQVFDSSEGREPLEFTVGAGQVIPGFENGLLNMSVNEKKTINIACEDAYGPVREDMIQQVPRAELPQEIAPEVGMRLVSRTPDGHEIPLVVTEVAPETITVDANHPLAGKDLVFEVELMGIK